MKPSEKSGELIRLRVEGQDPGVEIFVIDGRFNLAGRGAGSLETELPPGLYKVKFKAGAMIKEIEAILEPGSGPVSVEVPELDFSTAAPLDGARTTLPEHARQAAALSLGKPHLQVGSGGQLLVFSRDLEENLQTSPAQGLSLRSLEGDRLVNFAEAGSQSLDEQWAGCLVELDPGPYRLRLQTHVTGSLEQTVIISPGWQTQVFLLRRTFGKTEKRARRADLANASIFISPPNEGFDPAHEDLRLVELARMGLAGGRSRMPADELLAISQQERHNPILALLAAHLLLLDGPENIPHAAKLSAELSGLLGVHPDVESLRLRLGELSGGPQGAQPPGPQIPFSAPPMLRASWEAVVRASAAYPELVLPGSLAAQIAARLWGSGAWLVWQVPESQARIQPGEDIPELGEAILQLQEMLAEQPGALQTAGQVSTLDEMEEGLLRYLSRSAPPAAQPFMAGSLSFEAGSSPEEEEAGPGVSAGTLVRDLGLPGAAVQKAAVGLIEKLQHKGAKR